MVASTTMALALPAAASMASKHNPDAPTCPSGWYCVFSGNTWNGEEIEQTGSVPNLSSLDFDNNDGSVINGSNSKYDRLYYSADYGGAWVCIPINSGYSDLGQYSFNNGSGKAGYGQTVGDNVASIGVSSTACSKDI